MDVNMTRRKLRKMEMQDAKLRSLFGDFSSSTDEVTAKIGAIKWELEKVDLHKVLSDLLEKKNLKESIKILMDSLHAAIIDKAKRELTNVRADISRIFDVLPSSVSSIESVQPLTFFASHKLFGQGGLHSTIRPSYGLIVHKVDELVASFNALQDGYVNMQLMPDRDYVSLYIRIHESLLPPQYVEDVKTIVKLTNDRFNHKLEVARMIELALAKDSKLLELQKSVEQSQKKIKHLNQVVNDAAEETMTRTVDVVKTVKSTNTFTEEKQFSEAIKKIGHLDLPPDSVAKPKGELSSLMDNDIEHLLALYGDDVPMAKTTKRGRFGRTGYGFAPEETSRPEFPTSAVDDFEYHFGELNTQRTTTVTTGTMGANQLEEAIQRERARYAAYTYTLD